MNNLFELTDFPNAFTDMDGITHFISDLNSCEYKNDTIKSSFKNLNKLFIIFKEKLSQENKEIILDNNCNEAVQGLNPFYKTSEKEGVYLGLTKYEKNNKNKLDTYIHELTHFIDLMVGYITTSNMNYYSDNSCLPQVVNRENRLKKLPSKIFEYFCQFDDFKKYNTVDFENEVLRNPILYRYGPLMDILDALSLGYFCNNYINKKSDASQEEIVIYGHGCGTYCCMDFSKNSESINREIFANYMAMSVISEDCINLLASELNNIYEKIIDFCFEINQKIKEICNI